jgi:hypothetical protein
MTTISLGWGIPIAVVFCVMFRETGELNLLSVMIALVITPLASLAFAAILVAFIDNNYGPLE